MAGQGSNAASGLEDSDQVGGYALWLAKGPMQLQAKKTLTRLCGYADCSDLNLRWSHMPTCTLSTSLTHYLTSLTVFLEILKKKKEEKSSEKKSSENDQSTGHFQSFFYFFFFSSPPPPPPPPP